MNATAPDEGKSEQTTPEVNAETTQTTKDQGTPTEQSDEDLKVESGESETEDDVESPQSEESESTNADEELALEDVGLSEDEELVLELENGDVVAVSEVVEKYQELLSDVENNENWQKSNTEKPQGLADDKRNVDEWAEKLSIESVKEALKNEDLIEALDVWFDNPEENPFRQLNEDVVKEYTKAESDSMSVAIDREFFELEKMDDSLKDEAVKTDLVNFALNENITLTQAYDLRSLEWYKDQTNQLQNELKVRNGELSNQKKKKVSSTPKTPALAGQEKGAKEERFDGPSGSWENAEDRVLKRIGL